MTYCNIFLLWATYIVILLNPSTVGTSSNSWPPPLYETFSDRPLCGFTHITVTRKWGRTVVHSLVCNQITLVYCKKTCNTLQLLKSYYVKWNTLIIKDINYPFLRFLEQHHKISIKFVVYWVRHSYTHFGICDKIADVH